MRICIGYLLRNDAVLVAMVTNTGFVFRVFGLLFLNTLE